MNVYRQEGAIALFGSVAREEDMDEFSDKDVLIVDDDPVCRKAHRKTFRSAGWSPICYSWQRLQRAVDSERLFIQHLRQEAKILHDPQGRLRDLLSGFRPRADYAREINQALKFFTLLNAIPGCSKGMHWTLDVLAVGLRNFGVLYLANEGIYSFGLKSILNSLVKIGILKNDDVPQFLALRKIKRRYRSGVLLPDLTSSLVFGLVTNLSRRLQLELVPRKASPESVITLAVSNSNSRNWYERTRMLEAALFGLPSRYGKGDEELAILQREVRRTTRFPSEYGWTVKEHASDFTDRLRRVSVSRELHY